MTKKQNDQPAVGTELALEFDVPEEQELSTITLNIMAIARDNLKTDGFLDPAAFVVRDKHVQLYRVGFRNEDEKRDVYSKIVAIARQENAHAIITLNDAYVGDGDDDPETYYPGKLADEGDAAEAIVLTLSGPAIPTWCLTQRYTRSDSGIEFGELREDHGTEMSLLDGWATEKPQIN
jgi:hypothetical protein